MHGGSSAFGTSNPQNVDHVPCMPYLTGSGDIKMSSRPFNKGSHDIGNPRGNHQSDWCPAILPTIPALILNMPPKISIWAT